jgi:hypothetical protein
MGLHKAFPHFPLHRCACCFRMRILLTTIFLILLRRHFHELEPLSEFPHEVFGIINKQNIKYDVEFFSFFLLSGKLLKKYGASLKIVKSYTFFKLYIYHTIFYFAWIGKYGQYNTKKVRSKWDLH